MDERRRRFEAQALPHLDAAYNLARWLAPAHADDIVQDAMLRAFRSFDGFRGADARPWLFAIVRNCARDHAGRARGRAQVPLPGEEDGAALPDPAPGPEQQAAGASERRRLDAAIAALPEEFRTVLILRELEELSYREIALALDVPVGTVMSRLSRARAMLKDGWMTP
ncbi:MAG TPA: sigma-70 family RNA polymerase sigma factor [Rhizomicrobium sp.]|nr:sigma-70 family RNA polymerase sigma factor [Rhizomicrobium sp.]